MAKKLMASKAKEKKTVPMKSEKTKDGVIGPKNKQDYKKGKK